MTRRHPLDFSQPRISDLPPAEQRRAQLARDEGRRQAWLASRERRPIAERIINLFRGTPPALGRGGGACPPAAATSPLARCGRAAGAIGKAVS